MNAERPKNAAEQAIENIREANRRNMPGVVAGFMSANASVGMWVNEALAETAALRKLLADVADAPNIKAAKAIAAKAADVPAIEDPNVAAQRLKEEQRRAHMALETRIAEEKAKREQAAKVEAARRELARIEAERAREAELRALIAKADGTRIEEDGTINEPPAIDPEDLAGFHPEK